MESKQASILVIEDSPAFANLILRFAKIKSAPFQLYRPDSISRAAIVEKAKDHGITACLIDRNLQTSLDALEIIDLLKKEISPKLLFVGMSSTKQQDMDAIFLEKCAYYCNKNDIDEILHTLQLATK